MATASPSAPPVPPTPLVNNQAHLYRLLNLTVDEGTSIVRQIFDEKRLSYKPGLDLNAFLTQERSTIQNNKQIQSYLKDKLFPKNGIPPTHSLEDFDLTLLVSLLRNISSLGLQGPWKNEPKPGEEKPEDDLRRLQIMRNGLAHIKSTTGISEQDFQSKWSDTENVLLRLNKSLKNPDLNLQQRIKECETKPLDSEGIEQIIGKFQTSILHEIERLRTDVDIHAEQLQKHDKDIQTLKTNQEQKMSSEEESMERPRFCLRSCGRLKYWYGKRKLRKDLITLYRKNYSTLHLPGLFLKDDMPLLGFYVMPDINKVEIQRALGGKKESKSKLTTLFDVFYKEKKSCQNIYLVADAGFGKTAFSKRLVLTWCQAKGHIEDDIKYFKQPEINALSEFEFVFLLYLRDCSDECYIDEMIRTQICPQLANTHANVEAVLSKERCLVILDGLDEWKHPETTCTQAKKDFPHGKASTIITTARPWRWSKINLDSTQNHQRLELLGFNKESQDRLKKNVISQHMLGATDEEVEEQISKFDSAVAAKGISDMETTPLLLLYLLCVWCDEIDLGRSKCEIYCQIVELLLRRRLKRLEDHPLEGKGNIPACFADPKLYEYCNKYFSFLTFLGELAFQTLFSETSENRLVFEVDAIAEECLKKEVENSSIAAKRLKKVNLDLGLHTGLITQTKQSRVRKQTSKTSFSHKTVQEYFAALYISTCSDQNKDEVQSKVLKFCKSIQDILELSKVFIFIGGINAELLSSLSHKLMEVINNYEKTSEYRSTTERVSLWQHPLEDIQDMFISCMTEIPDNKHVNICLQDFFFDRRCDQDNYYTSLQRLAVNNKTNIKSIYIDYRVGHIDNREGQSLSEMIDSCQLSDLKNCQKIYCEDKTCKGEEIIHLLSTSVKYLFIKGIQRDDERKDALSCLTDEKCKTFHNYSQLETISIRNSTVNHKFLNYIINVKSKMKKIVLEELECEHDYDSCPGINFDLSQQPELRELRLISPHFTLCDIHENESKYAHSCLTDEQLKTFHNSSQLETIYIKEARISNKFLNCIINVKSLKQITLEQYSYSEHDWRLFPGINFDLSQQPELRELILISPPLFTLCDIYENEIKNAHSCLTDEHCKTPHNSSQLETIYIEGATVSHKFLNYIINVQSIKQITLDCLSCSERGDSCPRFNFDLSQHSELRELVLHKSNCTLCDTNEDESLLLHNLRNIELVDLWEAKMSSLLLRRLVEIIKQLEHSVRVKLYNCDITPWEEFVNIRDDICRSESFAVEEDVRNDRKKRDNIYRNEFVFATKK